VWKDHAVDAVAGFRSASEGNDIDALVETLSADAELISPLSGRMVFRGRGDLRILLAAVYGTVKGLRWTREITDGDTTVLIGEGRIGPLKLGDAMVLEMSPEGLICRIRPHLRPWLALTGFGLALALRLLDHPGVLIRALSRARG
jgi:hypothetical protein